jgi:hypothetical protein
MALPAVIEKEVHTLLLETLQDSKQVCQRSTQPVHRPGGDHVDSFGLDRPHHGIEPRSFVPALGSGNRRPRRCAQHPSRIGAAMLDDVRSWRRCGSYLLLVNISHFDPMRKWSPAASFVRNAGRREMRPAVTLLQLAPRKRHGNVEGGLRHKQSSQSFEKNLIPSKALMRHIQ